MATISSTVQIPNSTPGFMPWTSKAALDTTSGATTFTVTDSFGAVVYQGDVYQVQRDITSNSDYDTDILFFSKLQSTVANQNQTLTSQYNDLVPPAPSEPLPPAASQNQPNANALTGSPADEDNGQGQANTAGSSATPSASNASANGQGGTTGGTNNVTQGADGQATSNKNTFGTDGETPGKRLNNPLGNFSSYTYQISLYMITPDAYDAFIASGRTRINALNEATAGQEPAGGAFLIAQSGGINNESSKRAPGFEFDYGIDNLTVKTQTTGKESQTATNVTNINFSIIEPYGFSFLTKLKNASDAIIGYANQLGKSGPENPSKQFFILGIRFFGYNEAGNIITGKENYDGNTLDPNSTGNGLFETYYDIMVTSIKFRLDGKATTYNVEAVAQGPQAALSTKRGVLLSNKEVEASTAGEAIDRLLNMLNQEQLDMQKANGNIPNTYKIVYLNDASIIADSSMVSPEDIDKYKFPSSGIKNVNESNDAASLTAKPVVTSRTINFNIGDPILNCINNIITQSSFLRDALKVVYTTAIEPKKAGGLPENKPNTNKKVQWYNCSVEISNAQWDESIKDWAYDITYIIQTYETPVVDSIYANAGGKYYGPHKRYEYWYTGKNSEIISYVQELDNCYYNTTLAGGPDPTTPAAAPPATEGTAPAGNAGTGPSGIPTRPGQRTNRPRLGKLGNGLEAQNNYLTSLFDPGAYVTAKITIMGDPDFLVQDQASSINDVYNRFYGPNGFTISANGGQVYIEIDFKEAIDYESQTGVLSINDKILFWKYPDNLSKKPKGVSYMVQEIESKFANGSFRQMVKAIINDLGPDTPATNEGGREPESSTTGSGTTNTPTNPPTNPPGLGVLKKEFLPATKPTAPTGTSFYNPNTLTPSYVPQPVTTPAGFGVLKRVADDDGNGGGG
jgi:hypothetical protein